MFSNYEVDSGVMKYHLTYLHNFIDKQYKSLIRLLQLKLHQAILYFTHELSVFVERIVQPIQSD